MTHRILPFLLFVLTLLPLAPAHAQNRAAPAEGPLAPRTVTYKDGDTVLEGYWVPSQCTEEKGAMAPVVLVVHQWRGLSENEKLRADMLSELCYNAFAIDMYGVGVRPKNNEEAAKESGKFKDNPELALRRMNAALDFVNKQMNVDTTRIAAIGYCFGGGLVLDLARSGAPLKGVISFHGNLSPRVKISEPGAIKASIQVHHGALDPHVPQLEVQAFIQEMTDAKADWSLTEYADAVHAFTQMGAGDDPSTGVAYNQKADYRSWEAAVNFLDEVMAPDGVMDAPAMPAAKP